MKSGALERRQLASILRISVGLAAILFHNFEHSRQHDSFLNGAHNLLELGKLPISHYVAIGGDKEVENCALAN